MLAAITGAFQSLFGNQMAGNRILVSVDAVTGFVNIIALYDKLVLEVFYPLPGLKIGFSGGHFGQPAFQYLYLFPVGVKCSQPITMFSKYAGCVRIVHGTQIFIQI